MKSADVIYKNLIYCVYNYYMVLKSSKNYKYVYNTDTKSN